VQSFLITLPDKQRLSSLAQKGNDEMGTSSKVAVERAIQNLHKCAAYCMNEIDCRRTQVLKYFGENFPSDRCNNTCDNCRRGTGNVHWEDVTEQAQLIVKVVSTFAEEKLPKLTLNLLRSLFSNSKEKKLDRYRAVLDRRRVASEVTDSNGKVASKALSEKILHGMVVSDYLREDSEMTASSFTAAYVSIGAQADSLLAGMGRLSICCHAKVSKRTSRSSVGTEDIEDDELPLSGELFPSQTPLTSTSSPANPSRHATLVKSHAMVCPPSKKPWEATKSGKLGLKTKSAGSSSSSRAPEPQVNAGGAGRSHNVILTESDDEDFDTSRFSTSRGGRGEGANETVDLTSKSSHHHRGGADSGLESDMSPEIYLKTKPLPQAKKRQLGAAPDGDGCVLNVKQRNLLRSWLNEYRKRFVVLPPSSSFVLDLFILLTRRWDSYWNYLNNSTVAEMTRKVPLSTEALMNIGGIGEQKVKEHGTHIVATIWSFLQRNNLLSLFPEQDLSEDHPPYDLPLCPTWRDPVSPEAERIRAASTAIKRESPIKPSSEVNPYQKTSPYTSSSSAYLPYSGFNSSSNSAPLFDSPPPPKPPSTESSSAGLYTFHSRPGAPSNLIQRHDSPSLSPSPSNFLSNSGHQQGGQSQHESLSRSGENPYARYLNQRSGDRVSPGKRPSPSGSEDENNPIRRRISETAAEWSNASSHIADPTHFLVSPDN
jgi:hypothetical protein